MNNKPTIVWVGISLQKNTNKAFDPQFISGKILQEFEESLCQFTHYKTNLVDFAPLNENQKLRYPTFDEILKNQKKLIRKIKKNNPILIIGMGALVSRYLSKILLQDKKIKFISIYHPSYIAVYKRKNKEEYMTQVIHRIQTSLLENNHK